MCGAQLPPATAYLFGHDEATRLSTAPGGLAEPIASVSGVPGRQTAVLLVGGVEGGAGAVEGAGDEV